MRQLAQNFSFFEKAGHAKSVDRAFRQFLDTEISIAQGIRSKASLSQNHLRSFLKSETDRDQSFPRVLSIAESDFIGGSFGRKTKTWPLDDIDIYFPLDGLGLYFINEGIRQPFSLVSDGVLNENPLIRERWMTDHLVSSTKLVTEFAAVIRRHYPAETEVRPAGEAISIRMKQGETQDADGLGYDVVPCFALKPQVSGDQPFYLIPDGGNGWIRTNPRLDGEVSDYLHESSHGVFKKSVRLVKYWNAEKFNRALPSYFIELSMMRAALDAKSKNELPKSIGTAVAAGLMAVLASANIKKISSFVALAPNVECNSLSDTQLIRFIADATLAQTAEVAQGLGKESDAITTWGQIFGEKFPKAE